MLINSVVLIVIVLLVGFLSYLVGTLVSGLYWQDKIIKNKIHLKKEDSMLKRYYDRKQADDELDALFDKYANIFKEMLEKKEDIA